MPADPARLEHLLEVYKGLVEVSALINGITDSCELMPAILDVARRVMNSEAASLFLVNASGDLELTNASGDGSETVNGAEQKVTVPRGRGVSGWVLERREPVLIRDAYADPRFYREVDRRTGFTTRSMICVPLTRNETEIGVLQVLNPLDRTAFDEADLEAVTAYGNLAATAIDKLRTIERQQAQERVAQEFSFAREIQASFLPQTLPQLTHFDFAATYRPAQHVGGDFYDVLVMGPDEIYFVIGDVSGKGMPAALLMAQAVSILRLILVPGITPLAALTRWNQMLIGHTIRGMFITALIGRLACSTGCLEICSAGHCNPLRVSADGGLSQVRIAGTPPLGLLPEIPGRSERFTLDRGEWLVLYTDGLVESFNEKDELLDREGVERILARPFSRATEMIDTLIEGELAHRGAAPPHDDLTILVLGYR